MQKHVIVSIQPDGKILVDAIGFEGTACELDAVLQALERELAIEVSQKKPEWYRGEKRSQQRHHVR